MSNVVLYHTDGCHLCEEAHAILIEAGLVEQLTLRDIVDDAQLIERFQTSIPVVEFSTGQLLFWPFSLNDIFKAI